MSRIHKELLFLRRCYKFVVLVYSSVFFVSYQECEKQDRSTPWNPSFVKYTFENGETIPRTGENEPSTKIERYVGQCFRYCVASKETCILYREVQRTVRYFSTWRILFSRNRYDAIQYSCTFNSRTNLRNRAIKRRKKKNTVIKS